MSQKGWRLFQCFGKKDAVHICSNFFKDAVECPSLAAATKTLTIAQPGL